MSSSASNTPVSVYDLIASYQYNYPVFLPKSKKIEAKIWETLEVFEAEELYGKSMGDTVSRETDVHVIYIDPLNRGEYVKDSYLDGMEHNIELIKEAFTK